MNFCYRRDRARATIGAGADIGHEMRTEAGHQAGCGTTTRRIAAAVAAIVLAGWVALAPLPATAEDPPYDDQLMRLAEILGALHHLRPLCGAAEDQVWREQMTALIDAEQPSEDRRKKLADRFNRSYRGLAETHRVCSPAARTLIERYTLEGAALAQEVVVRWGRS